MDSKVDADAESRSPRWSRLAGGVGAQPSTAGASPAAPRDAKPWTMPRDRGRQAGSAGHLDQRHDHAARAAAERQGPRAERGRSGADGEGRSSIAAIGSTSRAIRTGPAPPQGGDGSTGAAGNVGGYNNFWLDPGERVAVVDGQRRSSLIIDPPDGRVPALTPEARARGRPRAQDDDGPRPVRPSRVPSARRALPAVVRSDDAARAELLLQQQPADRADAGSRDDPDGNGPRRPHRPHRRQAPAQAHPAVDGRFDRPLGRRHAGGRHHQLPAATELPRLVREPARRRALPPRRRQHHQLPVHR